MLKEEVVDFFEFIHKDIISQIEKIDGKKFVHDLWDRTDPSGVPGGGGETCILTDGNIFEKAGVNLSKVFGTLDANFVEKLGLEKKEANFFATGVSLVLHPYSPMIPTTHANWRYLQIDNLAWFGGGSDLTPYYLDEDDAKHFHQVLKNVCDKHDPGFYTKFKEWCDKYFYLPHRQETRGIGGIFFDHLGKENPDKINEYFLFVKDLASSFCEQYLPIVSKNKTKHYTDQQKDFQLIRRGRYVEFNLLYDRGTHFGLQTNGRIESILMSLPANVKWPYNFQVQAGSAEDKLIERLKKPHSWV